MLEPGRSYDLRLSTHACADAETMECRLNLVCPHPLSTTVLSSCYVNSKTEDMASVFRNLLKLASK